MRWRLAIHFDHGREDDLLAARNPAGETFFDARHYELQPLTLALSPKGRGNAGVRASAERMMASAPVISSSVVA
jgi:hypothetical protein